MKRAGTLLIAAAAVLSLIGVFKTEWIIPYGYELAIDGLVVVKGLSFVFFLYLAQKVGFWLLHREP